MVNIIIFVLGTILLSLGGKFLVDLGLLLAKRFNLSAIVAGAIFIAFITAMPETFITLYAAIRDSSEIAFGNLVGSNIMNIPLAIGLPAIITKIRFLKSASRISLILILSTLIASLFLIDGNLNQIEGALLLLCYFIYVIYVIKREQNNNHQEIPRKEKGTLLIIVLFLISGISLLSGAYLMVESSLKIVEGLGISKLYAGMTILAFGSILSETTVSFAAALKKEWSISISNILGDNIFTMFVVLGLTGILRPFSVSLQDISLSILPMIIMTGLLFLMTRKKKHEIGRIDGFILIISYLLILILQTIFL